jgi:hypothetical protein
MLTIEDLKNHVAEEELNRHKYLFQSRDRLPDFLSASGLTIEESKLEPYDRNKHFAMGFFGSKEWLFQGFEKTQPQTYKALVAASGPYILFVNNPIIFVSYIRWFMDFGGHLIEFKLQNVWETDEEMSFPLTSHRDYKANVTALGHDLTLAYSSYCKGFNILKSFLPSDNTDELPVIWEQIYLPMLKSKGVDDPSNCPPRKIKSLLEKEFQFLYSKFPSILKDHKKYKNFECGATPSLRLFLETRVDSFSSEGDYIIMQSPSDPKDIINDSDGSPVFFRVKNFNWTNIERLINPSKAIDDYVSHKLKDRFGDFDFDPYCEPI